MNIETCEMTDHELEVIDGGVWPLFLAGLAAGAAGYLAVGIIENWEDFKKGVVEGYNSIA